eukprot:scaffold24072_cov125-Amphora_coffeaeformis.AAC.4
MKRRPASLVEPASDNVQWPFEAFGVVIYVTTTRIQDFSLPKPGFQREKIVCVWYGVWYGIVVGMTAV